MDPICHPAFSRNLVYWLVFFSPCIFNFALSSSFPLHKGTCSSYHLSLINLSCISPFPYKLPSFSFPSQIILREYMESSTFIFNVLMKTCLKVKFRSPCFKRTRNMTTIPNHNSFLIFAVFKALYQIFLPGSLILLFSLPTKHIIVYLKCSKIAVISMYSRICCY